MKPDYEAIRRRLAAATPHLVPCIPTDSEGVYRVNSAAGRPVALIQWGSDNRRADMLLFAHAPADIAALLATIDRQRAVIETLRAAVEQFAAGEWGYTEHGFGAAREALAAVAAMEVTR